MKSFARSCTPLFAGLLGTLALTGCAGNTAFNFPDTPAEVHPGVIHGSVFGGHAPVVGAHVYVMEVGHTGTGSGQYASAAGSRMTSGYYGSDTHGNYVITDNKGGFNITGDYSCDAGVPVYIAATGGADDGSQNITINQTIFYGSVFGLSFIEFLGVNNVGAGQLVTFSGLTGNFAFLNNTTQTVFGTVQGGFFITIPEVANVNGSATGTATPDVNPAITNMAMLGLCPTPPQTFANTLNFVYMNEVSTTALAYGMGGFGSGPFNIGGPSTNTKGLYNAAINAGQLYDIQGGNDHVTADGEGHVARTNTPAGNGVVPQTTLDTLGNILAACVDSPNVGNSSSDPVGSGASINCSQLFTYATSNGIPYGNDGYGTIATDTATAAFNIAHYPAGAPLYSQGPTGFVRRLYALQGSEAIPFNPYLTSAPNDFTVGITYPLSLNSYLGKAESIAVDGAGNVWATAQSNNILFQWSPVGVLQHQATANYVYGYVSVDPSNNAWAGSETSNSAGITKLSQSGTLLSGTGAGYIGPYNIPLTTITDSSGNAYVGSKNGSNQSIFTKISGTTGGVLGTIANLTTALPSPDDTNHGSIDSAGYLWITSEVGTRINRINPANGATLFTSIVTPSQPEVPAIDAGNNAWIPIQYNNTVDRVTATGTVTNPSGATLSNPFGSAVDGTGHVWVANRAAGATGGGSIVEYGTNSVAISPTTNYTLGGVLTDSLNLAIDPSGALWITNYGGNQIVEMMGPIAPVVTPLSFAAGAGKLGTRP
jgi:streptogramin lyase